jgi:hypothetical protein
MGLNYLENMFTIHMCVTKETVMDKWKALKASKKDWKNQDKLVKEFKHYYNQLIQYTPSERFMLTSAVIA